MALYGISDLHLSFSCDKPMDVFGGAWQDYVSKIETNWKQTILPDDVVVIPGDISWGMTLEQALVDFKFIHNLPGKKILLKGNHDYWWTGKSKMEIFFQENGLTSLSILHNSFIPYGEYGICGTRGWINEGGKTEDKKVLLREAGRLRASLKPCIKEGLIPIVFLHYPPVYGDNVCMEIYEVLKEFEIKMCYYGHIHGLGFRYAIDGIYDNIRFQLISCDYTKFYPVKII